MSATSRTWTRRFVAYCKSLRSSSVTLQQRADDNVQIHEIPGSRDVDGGTILFAGSGIDGWNGDARSDGFNSAPVHFGGPVEAARGFVLHSTDYTEQATLVVGDVGLTATMDILRVISRGEGPRRKFFALGYAGWGPGQLDAEIQANGWLTAPSDNDLLFDEITGDKWRRAIGKLGVDPFALSGDAGHA